MDKSEQTTLGQRYEELVSYLSSFGNSRTNFSEANVFTQVRNNKDEVFLQFRLDYPRDIHGKYDYDYVQVAWRLLGVSNFSAPHKFKASLNQKVIFDIILFEIISWKLQNIDKIVAQTITTVLDSETISNWLKTKEEQIRTEEKIKFENHLSMNEFRTIIQEELSKISINLKIGDK